MVMKKMLQLCKREKRIVIYYMGAQKLLSNGFVAADITGTAPNWGIEDIIIALDMPEEKAEGFEQIEKRITDTPPKKYIDMQDFKILERMTYSININGVVYQPFLSVDKTLVMVDMELLSVFRDEGIKTYCLGYIDGLPEVFITVNGLCVGIASPSRIDLEHLKRFTDAVSAAAKNSISVGFLDAGGQVELQD